MFLPFVMYVPFLPCAFILQGYMEPLERVLEMASGKALGGSQGE
jgi:hypothetical protein